MNPILTKLDVCQEVARELFQLYDLSELEHIRDLILQRRQLSNKHFFARNNQVTGKTAQKMKEQLEANASSLVEIIDHGLAGNEKGVPSRSTVVRIN